MRVTVAVRAPAAEAAGITRLAATNAVTTINRRTVRIIVPLPPAYRAITQPCSVVVWCRSVAVGLGPVTPSDDHLTGTRTV